MKAYEVHYFVHDSLTNRLEIQGKTIVVFKGTPSKEELGELVRNKIAIAQPNKYDEFNQYIYVKKVTEVSLDSFMAKELTAGELAKLIAHTVKTEVQA